MFSTKHRKVHAPVIAASEKNCMGFKNRTDDPADEIVADLVSGKVPGVLILDPEKVGEVAVRVAQQIAPVRKKLKNLPELEEIKKLAKTCRQCNLCQRACPQDLKIPQAMKAAAEGNIAPLTDLYEYCIGCGRCEEACPEKLNIHSFIVKAGEKFMMEETNFCRAGRGAVQDVEITQRRQPNRARRNPRHPRSRRLQQLSERRQRRLRHMQRIRQPTLHRRDFRLLSHVRRQLQERRRQNTLRGIPRRLRSWRRPQRRLMRRQRHIAGAAIKVANIFAKRNLRGNYEEIADYIYNRLGAVGLAWGAYSQKAAAIAAGFWRLGIPVLVGPHGSKYRRMLLGREDKPEDWEVYDARTGNKVNVGPAPEHLFQTVETPQKKPWLPSRNCASDPTTHGKDAA